MSKIKVLFFAADPLSTLPDGAHPRLRLDEDVRQIKRKVRMAEHRDRVEFDDRWAARADDLLQALNEMSPQVVHFSGHGTREGLVLVGADGRTPHTVTGQALARLFTAFRGDIRVVVLNACFSYAQARAIAGVVGCAIGTRSAISDEAAITFGASFYRAIAFGNPVQAAFEQACTALALEYPGEQDTPQLVTGPDVDPAQLYLIRPAGPPKGAAPRPPAPPPRDAPPQRPGPPPSLRRPGLALRWGRVAAAVVGVSAGVALANSTLGDSREPAAARVPVPGGEATDSAPKGRITPLLVLPGSASAAPAAESGMAVDVASAKTLYDAGDYAAAFPRFQRAADAGNPEAMSFLGIMYLEGQGTARQEDAAIRWLRQAAQERDARGMNALGVAYERGTGVDQSNRWALHWYRAAAGEKGYGAAMSNLAGMFRQGRGVDQSYDSALVWYRRAAEAGYAESLVDAGMIHEQGLAGRPDPGEALRLYRAAAEAGLARGMFAMGRVHQEGRIVPRDYGEARSWYLKAVDAGSADAMNNMGVLYVKGWGVPRSRREAIRWFRRAADAGSPVAEGNLAALDAD